jgi:hypothetical protein
MGSEAALCESPGREREPRLVQLLRRIQGDDTASMVQEFGASDMTDVFLQDVEGLPDALRMALAIILAMRDCRGGAHRRRWVAMWLVSEFAARETGTWVSREPGVTVSPGEDSAQVRAAVILTPDQRVRVFVSSTLEELAAERAAALRAIRRLHLVPVWFESGARPHPPQSMDRAYLEQSQIFVGIYWQRYGWVGPGMEISGLENEFRLATGKPMLLYLKHPAPHQEPGLSAMIDGIRESGAVSYRLFATAREWSGCWSTTLRCC